MVATFRNIFKLSISSFFL